METIFKKLIYANSKHKRFSIIREVLKENKNIEIRDFCDAFILYYKTDFDEALKISRKHNTLEFGFLEALCLIELKNFSNAEKIFNKIISEDNSLAYPYNGLGVINFLLNNYQAAISYYYLSIEKDKKYFSPYINLGRLNKTIGNYDESVKFFYQSIGIDNTSFYPFYELVNIKIIQKKYSEAKQIAKERCDFLKKDENNSIEDGKYYLSMFESSIDQINEIEKTESNFNDIKENTKDPIKKILKDIKDSNIEEKTFENKKKFLQFIKPKEKNIDEKNFRGQYLAAYYLLMRNIVSCNHFIN